MAIYVKAFSLVLKTVSKPLAKSLKETAKSNPTLRRISIALALRADALYQSVMSPAVEPVVSSSGRRMKLAQKPKVTVMTEEQALQAAGDFISEAFVFGVAGGLVYWEQQKSAEKDAKKAEKASEERAANMQLIAMQQRTLRDMTEVLREFEADRRAYTARLLELEQRVGGGKSWMSKREGVGAIARAT